MKDIINLSERNLYSALSNLLYNFPQLTIALLVVLGFI